MYTPRIPRVRLARFFICAIIESANCMATVETIRDFAIIFLALSTIATQIILVLLLLEIRNLSKLLRYSIKPILESADETVRTVRGTSVFVSDNVVTPVVRVSSFAAGVTEALRVIVRRGQ
jgi:hypothetical protein